MINNPVEASQSEKVYTNFINTNDIEERINERIEAKITVLENELLETLSIGCETLGVEDPDGAIVYDTAASGDSRRMSIGAFMFQRRTIKHYIKMRDGINITNAEAIAIAIDREKASDLARYVIFEKGKVKNEWYNCNIKNSLDGQVKLINSLR